MQFCESFPKKDKNWWAITSNMIVTLVWCVQKELLWHSSISSGQCFIASGITKQSSTPVSRIGWEEGVGVEDWLRRRCRTVCTRWHRLRVHSVTSRHHSVTECNTVLPLNITVGTATSSCWLGCFSTSVEQLKPSQRVDATYFFTWTKYPMARLWNKLTLNWRTWWKWRCFKTRRQ